MGTECLQALDAGWDRERGGGCASTLRFTGSAIVLSRRFRTRGVRLRDTATSACSHRYLHPFRARPGIVGSCPVR